MRRGAARGGRVGRRHDPAVGLGLRGASSGMGRNVYLRRPGERDRAEFLERVRDSRRLHRSWVAPPTDDATFTAYLRKLRRDTHAGFLVCRTADEAIAGVFNVSEIVRGSFQSAFLGYYAFEPFAGKGSMSEG